MSQNPGQGERETVADDFTRIAGIGSKIAQRLLAAGIRTYADLAARSVADITGLLPDVTGLSAGRVDNWRDQARALAAAAPATATAPEVPVSAQQNGQRYESFLVRVLLNEDGSIRRTTARHIRTGEERHWPGLERDGLPAFIMAALSRPAEMAGTAETAGETETAGEMTAEAPAEPQSGQPGQAGQATSAPVPVPRPGEPGQAAASVAPMRAPRADQPRPDQRSSAVLSLDRVALRAAEPFTMTMRIQLASTVKAGRLAYNAVIVARPMTGGPKRTVAQSAGLFASTAPTISIDAAGLPAGVYKLDGAVSLHEPGGGVTELAGLVEGLLVQVLPG